MPRTAAKRGRRNGKRGLAHPRKATSSCMPVWDLRKSWEKSTCSSRQAALRRTLTAPCGSTGMPKAAWTLKDRKKRTSGKASGITFFFNYRTMDTADTPISFLPNTAAHITKPFAYELSRARLRLFVLGEVLDETRCLAEDLMTGDHFYVNMTPEMASHHDLGDVILGNIFQNQSLCMNYEKSFRLSPLSRNKLHTILQQCLDWFLIQGPDLTWVTSWRPILFLSAGLFPLCQIILPLWRFPIRRPSRTISRPA